MFFKSMCHFLILIFSLLLLVMCIYFIELSVKFNYNIFCDSRLSLKSINNEIFNLTSSFDDESLDSFSKISLSPIFVDSLNCIFFAGKANKIYVFSNNKKKIIKYNKLPGNIKTKPVFVKNNLLLGLDNGYIVNIDAVSLRIKWKQKVDSLISGSLVVDNNSIYYISRFATVYSLNLKNGKILWLKKRSILSNFFLNVNLTPSLCVIDDNNLHVNALACAHPDGWIDFFHLISGKIIKVLKIGDHRFGFPSVSSNIIFFKKNILYSSFNDGIILTSIIDFKNKWKNSIKNIIRISINDGFIFAATSKKIVKINSINGREIWKFYFKNSGEVTSLIIDEFFLYFGIENHGFFILDKYSGKIIRYFKSKSGFKSELSLSKSFIYAINIDGYLYSFKR